MSRNTTALLLVLGLVFTTLGQVKHPALAYYTEAFAALGFALAALAKTHDLGNTRRTDRRRATPGDNTSEHITPVDRPPPKSPA